MQRIKWLIVAVAVILLAGCSLPPVPLDTEMANMADEGGMAGMEGVDTEFTTGDLAPLVLAFHEGEDLFFIHTEASDPQVAQMLTEMMGPQVVVVPALADVSEELVDALYVFTNGVEGMGPLGFQPDIFGSVPGDETYTPLRRIHRVTWQEGATPRVLKSTDELMAAEEAGELTIEESDIVVNAPVLVWPGGQR